jgi:hypothetical protein
MYSVLAHFLSAREIIALSHASARERHLVAREIPRVLDERFRGRARPDAMLDWQLLLMFGERASHPMRYVLVHKLSHHHCAYESMSNNIRCIEISDDPFELFCDARAILENISKSTRDLMMRGDVVTCYTSNFFWSGEYLTNSSVIFDIPREFPPDYFDISPGFPFVINLAKYREQILHSQCNVTDKRGHLCWFVIAIDNREFHFKFRCKRARPMNAIEFCGAINVSFVNVTRVSDTSAVYELNFGYYAPE